MQVTEMVLPEEIQFVLNWVEERGYEAYVVGGCVRDLIMGRVPHDWDIATSAKPEQIQLIFDGYPQVLDGLKHGTVTVIVNKMPIEITTFRIDGRYSDGRRPDSISFTTNLEQDLARRDFTINACAYSSGRLIDPFGGSQDIKLKIIRCVGDPIRRFTEDSLRILRGLRFSSELSFDIEEQTKEAMFRCTPLLGNVSQERITTELSKALLGENAQNVLNDFHSLLIFLIPELDTSSETGPEHQTAANNNVIDSLFLSITSLSYSKKDLAVRLALLLSGIGRIEIAEQVLQKLRLSSKIINKTLSLLRYFDVEIEQTASAVKHVLRHIGIENFRLLLDAKYALSNALRRSVVDRKCVTAVSCVDTPEDISRFEEILNRVETRNECYNLSGLDVSGNDLIDIGVPQGRAIGEMLDKLLNMVIDEKVENTRDALIKVIHNFIKDVDN
jgi:tRNA nucleotidyltransferase (CCA-adding enzyme)